MDLGKKQKTNEAHPYAILNFDMEITLGSSAVVGPKGKGGAAARTTTKKARAVRVDNLEQLLDREKSMEDAEEQKGANNSSGDPLTLRADQFLARLQDGTPHNEGDVFLLTSTLFGTQ